MILKSDSTNIVQAVMFLQKHGTMNWGQFILHIHIENFLLTLYHSDTYFPVSIHYHSDTYFTLSIHYHLDPYIPVYRPFEQIHVFPCLKINRVIFTFFLKTETPDVYKW